ncbi:fatty acyl-AMP ligase [Methylobacterium sp. WL12]|uniref:AMP-binding protein n=1 Tax=Methylobacterium sp. WL12 TaxID=2603890 RepID=UPI0011C8E539|nr:AMP-binding protein [Methylobacterium sp. WL12]TXM63986.1 fatty acyl-AMP ligase [Methylobacterium sp. WL12]
MFYSVMKSIKDRAEVDQFWSMNITSGARGPEDKIIFNDLYSLACDTAEMFKSFKVLPHDRIVTLLPTGRALIQSILGSWASGAVVSVVSPSIDIGRSSLSLERLVEMLEIARPKVIIYSADDVSELKIVADEIGAVLLHVDQLPKIPTYMNTEAHTNCYDDPAIIQFTSGSTGLPKAVVIEHGQLVDNARTVASWTGFTADDCFVSWLPLHHDFGFVISFCMPLLCSAKLVLIPTESFGRNPLIWLKVMSEQKATFSGAPPSGISILTKSVFSQKAASYDLSSLQCLWLGSEPVSPILCDEFEKAYKKSGLKEGVLSAAYGMAETTLAVSVRPQNSYRNTAWISKEDLYKNGNITLLAPFSDGSIPFLSNGPSIPGVKVTVRDDFGNDINECKQGQIAVSSSMVTNAYFGSMDTPQKDGWFETGDLGFLKGNEVFITGRSKDVLIKNGVNMPAHLIEEAAFRSFPNNITRAVAFSVASEKDMRDRVILGIEIRGKIEGNIQTQLRSSIIEILDFPVDEVLILSKGSIPVTTSGKTQRTKAKSLFQSEDLGVQV